MSKRRKRSENYQLDALAAAAIEVEASSAINNSPPDSAAQTIGARVTSSVRTGVHAASTVARAIGNRMSPKRPIRRSKRHQPK